MGPLPSSETTVSPWGYPTWRAPVTWSRPSGPRPVAPRPAVAARLLRSAGEHEAAAVRDLERPGVAARVVGGVDHQRGTGPVAGLVGMRKARPPADPPETDVEPTQHGAPPPQPGCGAATAAAAHQERQRVAVGNTPAHARKQPHRARREPHARRHLETAGREARRGRVE